MSLDQPFNPDQPDRDVAADLTAMPLVSHAGGAVLPRQPEEDAALMHRLEHLPREVGWLLIYVGVLGVILPGVVGIPFLLAGASVVTPGGPKRIARWVGRRPPGAVRAGVSQIVRLLDDLDRRYPPIQRTGDLRARSQQ
jgi:hypothetical protein